MINYVEWNVREVSTKRRSQTAVHEPVKLSDPDEECDKVNREYGRKEIGKVQAYFSHTLSIL